jgi:hypothetical protein
MNDRALEYLDNSDGWEIGVGPSIVIVDKGKGRFPYFRNDLYSMDPGQSIC